MGQREGTVRVWLHRGKLELRRQMEEDAADTGQSAFAVTGKERGTDARG